MKWESSRADKAADRKGARKAGMTLKEWERSAADKKADAKARKKMKKGKRK